MGFVVKIMNNVDVCYFFIYSHIYIYIYIIFYKGDVHIVSLLVSKSHPHAGGDLVDKMLEVVLEVLEDEREQTAASRFCTRDS